MNDRENRRVIVNANVITMDDADRRCRTLAVEGDRIRAVGAQSELRGFIDRGLAGGRPQGADGPTRLYRHPRAYDADGVPAHGGAPGRRRGHRGRPGKDRRPGRAHGQRANGCGAVISTNRRWRKNACPPGVELDRAVPDHPVFLMHVTCHMCSLNTRALDILQPPLSLEGLDTENGAPTGVIRDPGILTHVHPAMARILPLDTKVGFLRTAAEMALEHGITTLHALDGGDLGPGDTRVIWQNRHRLPVRVVCYNQSMDLAEVRDMGLPRIGGCICSDGAFEAHTAALFEPYADQPDNYGALTYSQETMDDFILAAHRSGLQIAVHCESDRSIEQVLWAMEKAIRAFPRPDHRHRIEHLELPTANQIRRMAAAGIMASMQPAFIPAFIGQAGMAQYEALLGRERLGRVHPYRAILDAGVPISGGSDSPVTPYHPLCGVQAAVNHPNPAQRIGLREALRMFTVTAAWSAFEEDAKGSVEAGKLADLVVLGKDPYDVPADAVQDIPVNGVCVGGNWRWMDHGKCAG